MARTKKMDVSSMHLLDLMERIAEEAKGNGSPKQVVLLKQVVPYAKALGERLNLTPLQAVMLSLMVNTYPDSEIETKDLARHLTCANISVLACYDQIKELISRHYIGEHRSKNNCVYYIPANAINAFRDNHDVEPRDYSNMDGVIWALQWIAVPRKRSVCMARARHTRSRMEADDSPSALLRRSS